MFRLRNLFALILLTVFFSLPYWGARSTQAVSNSLYAASEYHPVERFGFSPLARTLAAAFAEAGVRYFPEDRVSAFPDPSLGIGGVIELQRARSVNIIDGKRSYTARSWAKTVGELVIEKKLDLGGEDRLSANTDTPLSEITELRITRVARTNITESESIKYKVQNEQDYTRFIGDNAVITKGQNGKVKKTYLLVREDGELISKTLISTEIVEQSVTEIVRVGALKHLPSSRCTQYKDWVVDASLKNRINPNDLFYRMYRESSCNPNSVALAGYQGLFQYDPNLWPTLSKAAGYSGASVFDARSQIYVTAWAWANGHRSRWPIP